MALREYERRILAEIEHHLCEDDPGLADRMETFGADAPSEAEETPGGGWKPWVVCAMIAVVVIGLLALLFALTPGAPSEQPPAPANNSEVVVPGPGADAS
ncbi:DUF3040 domain-containing protein [Allosalinactinospora lopnorensis]|uniref:DUF3040 domain-containing protein n=1 Tax=Allosalinactinospora lopnorensis TaxID=1352348 RepID=UPI000623E993|nr:DUF3040 domain-containing protein [Allosalinactinospora lopnorensis]